MKNYIKEILEDAGWYSGRKIIVDYMLSDLKERGFEIVNPEICSLLEQYWNLKLEFKTPENRYSDIRLNVDAASDYDKTDLSKISELLNEELIPVGSIHNESALLLLTNSLRFYMLSEDGLYLLSNDFLTALDVIVQEKEIFRVL